MKILYAATGDIAADLLQALYGKGLVKAVLTAPDAPGKRGKTLVQSPVKKLALELGLEVYQPETIRKEAREHIASYGADTLLSFCYGKIFGPKFLSIFSNTFNVHPSILPKYRGPSPVYQAIRNGDRETGVSLQKIGLGIDEGDVFSTSHLSLDGTETEESLSSVVAAAVPSLVLPVLKDESRKALPQQGDATYTSFVSKEDGKIDFSLSGAQIHALIRASYPWPKAYVEYKGGHLALCSVSGSAFSLDKNSEHEPGTVVSLDKKKGLKIATRDSYIYVDRLQAPSRKEMDALSFVNGNRDIISSVLL